jgi:hypothetical protein
MPTNSLYRLLDYPFLLALLGTRATLYAPQLLVDGHAWEEKCAFFVTSPARSVHFQKWVLPTNFSKTRWHGQRRTRPPREVAKRGELKNHGRSDGSTGIYNVFCGAPRTSRQWHKQEVSSNPYLAVAFQATPFHAPLHFLRSTTGGRFAGVRNEECC